MFKLFIFLQILLTGIYSPAEKPKKKLSQLSVTEINNLFQEVNSKFKSDALVAELDYLCKNLNGSVLLAFGEKVFYKKEVGDKFLAKNPPNNAIDEKTLFELASLSKQFTAAAILKLNQEKRLNVTDTVTKYLTHFPYSKITIHHLLTHTSGLPEYMDFPEKDFVQDAPLTNAQLEKYLEEKKPKVLSQPGERYKYINTNYALLALIVETVTDTTFEYYIRKEIFEPAGLKTISFTTELTSKSNFTIGHLADKKERPFHFQNGVLGDKGIYSNVDELYCWIKAYLIDYKVLPEEIAELATQQQNKLLKGKAEEFYGYGFRIEDDVLGYLIYHGGLWRGFQNNMVYRPQDRYIFIVLSNFRNRAMIGVNGRLLRTIDGA
jgi:CubicO group peptidase (beta-lactamase class C family)